MSTQSAAAPAKTRNPIERNIVRVVLLLLVALLAFEYWTQRSFQKAFDALQNGLSGIDQHAAGGLTQEDVTRILGGKQPEFKGSPGQILLDSPYYEAYVWRSALKRKFTAPPVTPEIVDLFAIYSGEVRPDLIKYRTPEEKNVESFFSAYVIYVYYSKPDPTTQTRTVLNVVTEREKYLDEITPIPTKEELKKKHEATLQRDKLNRYKVPPTPEQLEQMDSWKHPRPRSDENMRNLPPLNSRAATEERSLTSTKATATGAKSP